MAKIPALKDLKITKEEGLTKDNIDSVIDVLKETPEEYFDTMSKKDTLAIWYQARALLKEETSDYFI